MKAVVSERDKIVGWKREGQDLVRKWKGHGALPQSTASVDDYLYEIRGACR
jgi:hypothetical protein